MRTLFLITARLKSTRLPRKVLLDLGGQPALVRMIDRVKQAQTISDIVVCTSTNPQDDPLEAVARQHQVACYRGSEDDVLDRLHRAAQHFRADYALNLTADCPLVDPEYIDKTVQCYAATGADLITAYDLPHGAYCWGIKVGALEKVCEIKAETDTEIWGDYFTKSGLFRVDPLPVAPALRRPELRLTLDYPEDLTVLRRVVDAVCRPGRPAGVGDMIAWLDAHPEVVAINRHCAAQYQARRRLAPPMRLKPAEEALKEPPR